VIVALRAAAAVLAAALAAGANLDYLRDVRRRRGDPHRADPRLASWGIWTGAMSVGAYGAARVRQWPSAVLGMAGAVTSLSVIVSGRRHGDLGIGWLDFAAGLSGGAGLILIAEAGVGMIPAAAGIIAAVLADLGAFLPTFKNARRGLEAPRPYMMYAAAAVLTLAASSSLTGMIYPLYEVAACSLAAILAVGGRRRAADPPGGLTISALNLDRLLPFAYGWHVKTRSAHSLTLSAAATAAAATEQALGDIAVRAAARQCDQLLAAHSPPVAKMSGLRHILSDRLSMDMNSRGWPADVLGFLFRHRPGPFTLTMHRLTGIAPRVEPIDPADGTERRLTGAEAETLGVLDTAGLWCWERRGLMMIGTTIAAEVSIRLVPARIGGWDGQPLARIRKGEPCGQVIPGLARIGRAGTATWPADPAALGAAVLTSAAGRPFGFAGERVTAGLIARLADM
jgi:hypothetical protein